MKYKITIAILILLSALHITCFAEDKTGITVHDTLSHGVYVTVGGIKIDCKNEELPFIDENNRTQVPVRIISETFGKNVEWIDDTQTVRISDNVNSENNVVSFTIGSDEMYKNGEIIKMDTQAQILNDHTFIPLKFLGEALDCDVDYTDFDMFSDITIELKSGLQGFKPRDKVTLWGNIQDEFHEGWSSIMPYEGEEPDLNANYINEYEVTSKYSMETLTFSLFWDTLYDKAYIKEDDILYTVDTDYARFIDSFLENTDIGYPIGDSEKKLFADYGWRLAYKINEKHEVIPYAEELGEFNPFEYYFAYNNELSKDIGLDMSRYSGCEVSVEIYKIRESMPKEFYPLENARGIIVKNNNEIIGAYISAGRHNVDAACSLKGNSFETITGINFDGFIEQRLKAEEDIVVENPEEIIKRYFKALEDKDASAAQNCMAKAYMFSELTVNILNTELYNEKIYFPFTNTMEEGENSLYNIKSVKNLEVKPFEYADNTDKEKIYIVKFDIEYENEWTLSSGGQYWECRVVYESDKTGWKLAEFGHCLY